MTEEPVRKRRIPPWVLGCGCGCLAVAIGLAIGAWLAIDLVRDAVDPERQWAQIGEILPHDERPTNLRPVITTTIPKSWLGIEHGGFLLSTLQDDDLQLLGILLVFQGEASVALDDIFETGGFQVEQGEVQIDEEEMERGEFELQGRKVRYMVGKDDSKVSQSFGGRRDDAAMFLDLSSGGPDGVLLLLLDRKRGGLESRSEITPEDVTQFLRGFDLWAPR